MGANRPVRQSRAAAAKKVQRELGVAEEQKIEETKEEDEEESQDGGADPFETCLEGLTIVVSGQF